MSRTSSVVKDRYNKKAYDEMKIRVSKGEKDKIQSYAISHGESLNAFVNRAIDEAMQHDTQGSTTTDQVSPATAQAPNQFTLPLSQEELEQLNRHCIICLCKKPDFIKQAIKEKLQRESPLPVPTKKQSPPQKGKLTPSVLLAEDGKRDTGTSTGKDRPLEESDLLP